MFDYFCIWDLTFNLNPQQRGLTEGRNIRDPMAPHVCMQSRLTAYEQGEQGEDGIKQLWCFVHTWMWVALLEDMQPVNLYSSLHNPTLQRSRMIKLSLCAVVFDCFTWVTKATSKWNHWRMVTLIHRSCLPLWHPASFLSHVLAQWVSWWNCWLDFYLKSPTCTRHWQESTCLPLHCQSKPSYMGGFQSVLCHCQ